MSSIEWGVHVLAFAAGLALFAATSFTVVTTMVVPRPTRTRISHLANWLTMSTFRFMANRRGTYAKRDGVLSMSGPCSVLTQLLVFVVSFIAAFGLMLFAVSRLGTMDSLYQSGATLLTLGIVEPTDVAQVVITFVAAFTGLVVIAILIGYLLSLYSAYTHREGKMAQLSLVAGEPAWGPEILSRTHLLGEVTDPALNVETWIDWASDLRMAQTINPVLNHYRSAGSRRNWAITLLAVLDAAALNLTTVKSNAAAPALVRLIAEGTQTLAVLRGHVVYRSRKPPSDTPAQADFLVVTVGYPGEDAGRRAVVNAIATDARSAWSDSPSMVVSESTDPGISRQDWDHACEILERTGLELADDLDAAWNFFRVVRSAYSPNAYALAQSVYAVRAPWSGERTPATEVIWPALATDRLQPPS